MMIPNEKQNLIVLQKVHLAQKLHSTIDNDDDNDGNDDEYVDDNNDDDGSDDEYDDEYDDDDDDDDDYDDDDDDDYLKISKNVLIDNTDNNHTNRSSKS